MVREILIMQSILEQEELKIFLSHSVFRWVADCLASQSKLALFPSMPAII